MKAFHLFCAMPKDVPLEVVDFLDYDTQPRD